MNSIGQQSNYNLKKKLRRSSQGQLGQKTNKDWIYSQNLEKLRPR